MSLVLAAVCGGGFLYICAKVYKARAAFYYSKVKKGLVSGANLFNTQLSSPSLIIFSRPDVLSTLGPANAEMEPNLRSSPRVKRRVRKVQAASRHSASRHIQCDVRGLRRVRFTLLLGPLAFHQSTPSHFLAELRYSNLPTERSWQAGRSCAISPPSCRRR